MRPFGGVFGWPEVGRPEQVAKTLIIYQEVQWAQEVFPEAYHEIATVMT
jgi:hypothetical protein